MDQLAKTPALTPFRQSPSPAIAAENVQAARLRLRLAAAALSGRTSSLPRMRPPNPVAATALALGVGVAIGYFPRVQRALVQSAFTLLRQAQPLLTQYLSSAALPMFCRTEQNNRNAAQASRL